MKLHFESDLPYQAAAIEAVCDLFRGQEVCRSVFTITAQTLNDSGQQSFEGKQFTAEGGIGNALQLIVDEELSENLQKVQLRNGLPPSDPLKPKQALDFTVEMETGTGKTYVYLRTVFELKHYQGLKLRAIGEMLQTTEETAKNTLFRATRKLRANLADV